MAGHRIETDSLGEVEVPAAAYWGAQTERARRNFPVSGERMPARLVRAMAMIKAEAAVVHGASGALADEVASAIRRAAEEVAAGEHADQFPVDVFQTGSGTSTHMNLNEVIANRASELLGGERGAKRLVHPNDHVNLGQSSNDVVPTAIHVAAYGALSEGLRPALEALGDSLEGKARVLDDVVKIGRTHLQDAVPVRLGQEISGWAQQIRNGIARLDATLPRLAELALGGTAVGTGLNAPPGFADEVIARLAARTGHPFVPAPNRFEALAARDAAVEVSGALRTVAVSLTKIANDLRWLSSGPRCGIGEITLPSLQPGSSIMPGKVNPVIPEAVAMVAARVIGNDAAIAWAGASGNFELNVMMPVIARDLLQSIELLAGSCRLFAERCVDGLEANRERAAELVERSLAMVTALAPRIGYDRAAGIAKEAFTSGRTVRAVAREQGVLSDEEIEAVLDPWSQTEGG
ncbi:MAG TPA: class II fumarate hydratase [Thermoanaerobaculia bacterium]|nr:class II fumarate hydratase [Thermoanaerobaculia bacterium]